jgi:N-acyl amino acid synthase of PEP-CTERM/exosortase system
MYLKEKLMLTLGDFKFIVATTPALLEKVYRLRYQVYVDEFGFEHAGDHPNGMETDEWDPTSIHMAALNPERRRDWHHSVGSQFHCGIAHIKCRGSFVSR